MGGMGGGRIIGGGVRVTIGGGSRCAGGGGGCACGFQALAPAAFQQLACMARGACWAHRSPLGMLSAALTKPSHPVHGLCAVHAGPSLPRAGAAKREPGERWGGRRREGGLLLRRSARTSSEARTALCAGTPSAASAQPSAASAPNTTTRSCSSAIMSRSRLPPAGPGRAGEARGDGSMVSKGVAIPRIRLDGMSNTSAGRGRRFLTCLRCR